jgi:hypothetical protein
MPRNVFIRALSIHLLFTASTSSFTITSTSTPTILEDALIVVPARTYDVEEAKATAAPELKRQATTNYCTEWSIVNGNDFVPAACCERG